MIASGELPSTLIGSRHLIPAGAVEAALKTVPTPRPSEVAIPEDEHDAHYYDVEQVSEKLNKSPHEIWNMVVFEDLKTEVVDGARLFPRRVVDDLLLGTKKPKPPPVIRSQNKTEPSVEEEEAVETPREFYGSTVEEAINKASSILKLPKDYLLFKVLDHGDAGFGTRLARIAVATKDSPVDNSNVAIKKSEAKQGPKPSKTEIPTQAQEPESTPVEGHYFYKPGQVAHLLGKDAYEVNQMIHQEKLPVVSVNGYRWIPAQAVEDLLSRNRKFRRNKKALKPYRIDALGSKGPEVKERPPADPTSFQEAKHHNPAGSAPIPKISVSDLEAIAETGGKDSTQEASEPQNVVHEFVTVLKALERKRAEEEDAEDVSSSLIGPDLSAQRVRELEDELRVLRVTLRQYEIDRLDAELENLRRGDTERSEALASELEQERSLHAESEQWTRALQSELDEEREGRKQDNLDARYEIDQLDAELENLRQDEEILRTELEQERFWRAESEQWARELQAELKFDEEQARRPATGESLALEESERYEREEYEERLAALSSELEELQSRLGENEAEKQALEKALSVEKEKANRLEADRRVLEEVRRLLGAEAAQPTESAEINAASESLPAGEPEGASSDLLIKTRGGQWVFRPPFALEDEEVELIQLVAGEDEITADQIKHRTGRRRAVDDLDDLLDRLADEGLEPITEKNDRYSFDPDFMQD